MYIRQPAYTMHARLLSVNRARTHQYLSLRTWTCDQNPALFVALWVLLNPPTSLESGLFIYCFRVTFRGALLCKCFYISWIGNQDQEQFLNQGQILVLVLGLFINVPSNDGSLHWLQMSHTAVHQSSLLHGKINYMCTVW